MTYGTLCVFLQVLWTWTQATYHSWYWQPGIDIYSRPTHTVVSWHVYTVGP